MLVHWYLNTSHHLIHISRSRRHHVHTFAAHNFHLQTSSKRYSLPRCWWCHHRWYHCSISMLLLKLLLLRLEENLKTLNQCLSLWPSMPAMNPLVLINFSLLHTKPKGAFCWRRWQRSHASVNEQTKSIQFRGLLCWGASWPLTEKKVNYWISNVSFHDFTS